MNPERPIFEKLGKKVGLAAAAALAMWQVACAKAEPIRAQAPTPTPSGTEQPIEQQPTPAPEPTATPEPTNTPEPKQEPTATATKEPTAAPKPPEVKSPFPVYGVFEAEYRSGNQPSYLVITTPLDKKVGAVVTYLNGLMECSAGKLNYGPGSIVVDLPTFLTPGVYRGRFGDSFDATYNPQRQSISGRLVIPPDPTIKTCDAQMIPFEAKLVGTGPESFVKSYIRSYEKAGLYTDLTRAERVKEDIARYIDELPPPPAK